MEPRRGDVEDAGHPIQVESISIGSRNPTGSVGASLEAALRVSTGTLRHPMSGLAAVLAAGARDLTLRLVAVYVVPSGPDPVELLAAAGVDAGPLGPPGPLEEDNGRPFRALASEAPGATMPSPFEARHPFSKTAHLARATVQLSGNMTGLVLVAADASWDPELLGGLVTAAAAFGALAASAQEAARLRQDLRRLRQDRALLAAGLQHDLRGPLTAIMGSGRTLSSKDATLTPEQRQQLLAVISTQAERLNHMVTESLSSHLPSPDTPVRHRLTDVGAVLRRAAEAAMLGRSGTISVEAPAVMIVTDEHRLERALLNLLDNALKYTPRGQPVHAKAAPIEQGVMLVVADAGPGVAREILPTLFEPYASDPGRSDGTGLGLHSVAQVADELGGGVAYARQGGWTRFSLTVPDLRTPPGSTAGRGGGAHAEPGGRRSSGAPSGR